MSSSLSAEDQNELAATQNTRRVRVHFELKEDEEVGITLSQNLQVKSIKPNSKAVWQLIIGDQILAVNGQAPTNADEAHELIKHGSPKLELTVNRKGNIVKPISQNRAKCIHLTRRPGYSYFVTTVKKVGKAHLGLGVKEFGDRITVTRCEENSLAACAFMVGDCILDVNYDRVKDVKTLRKNMVDSLGRYGSCTAVIERPDSAMAIYNTVVTVQFLSTEIDPQMAPDVVAIGQREVVRIMSNAGQKQTIKPIYRGVRTRPSSSATESNNAEDRTNQERTDGGGSEREAKPEKEAHTTRQRDSSAKHGKKRKHKHAAVNVTKNEESPIASDVQNPHLLQKVPSFTKDAMDKRFLSTLTFMPKFFASLR